MTVVQRRQLTLYEPRWHGHARWTLEEMTVDGEEWGWRIVRELESGWVRRPRGAPFVQMHEDDPLTACSATA